MILLSAHPSHDRMWSYSKDDEKWPFHYRYVKERAEEERREKRNKLKERKEEFRKLLEEAGLNGKSSFSDFAAKYSKDDRFRNIEKMRERESLFDEFLLEVRRREKEEKAAKREQVSFLSCQTEGGLGRGMHTHIEILISVTYKSFVTGTKDSIVMSFIRLYI